MTRWRDHCNAARSTGRDSQLWGLEARGDGRPVTGGAQRATQVLGRVVERGRREIVSRACERQTGLIPGGQDVHMQVRDLEPRDE